MRVLEGPAADVDAEGPLGIAWSETKDAERILLIAVKHENTDIRVLSVAALGAIASESDAAAAVVLDSLSDDSAVVRREGIVWLSKIGSLEALRALLGALTDSATEVRRASVLGLGHAGLVEAVPGLAAALAADRSSEVRADAASALGAVGEACAAPDLLKALEDPSEAVARAALNALRCLGPQNVVDYLRGRSE